MTRTITFRVGADSQLRTAFPGVVTRRLEGLQTAGRLAAARRFLVLAPWLDRPAVGMQGRGRGAVQPWFAPRGPRGQLVGGRRLPREVVGADQRARLIRAVVAVVAARGYPAASVREVLWRAGVSQETLYAHFAGVHDALLTACDAGLDWVLDGLESAVGAEAGANGVREGLRCLLERFASEPELAWCCFVEICRVGAPGEECRLRALERLAAALSPAGIDAGRDGAVSVPDELVAGGVWHAVETRVLAGGTASLTSLLPALDRHVTLCRRDRDGEAHPNGRRDA